MLKWTEISTGHNKVVKDIDETQNKLIYNLRQLIKQDMRYLLDGHYCLLTHNGTPEKIPLQTFIDLCPRKLIVVYEDTQVIKNRLELRDRKEYDEQLLLQFQDLEVSYAEEISIALNIPLLKIGSTSERNIIKNFLK